MNKSTIFQERLLYLLGLFILLVTRIGLQGLLYRAGFLALTADDYGRIVLAARWAQHPFFLWRGAWLPFHMYLFGTALKIRWDLLAGPRLIAIFFGAISIILMYRLATELSNRRSAGFLAALFLAFNPAHVWLSATPLTEMPATTLILGSLLCFVLFQKRANRPTNSSNHPFILLYLSSGLLAIANGFRYEAWMLSIVYSLYLAGLTGYKLYRGRIRLPDSLPYWIAAFLPWLFPVAWLIGNYRLTGDPLYFLGEITSYKLSHYGVDRSYWRYVNTLIRLDPAGVILAIAGFAVLLKKIRSNAALISWYLLMVWAPFLIFTFLHGGQNEPAGNSIRYLAPFFFLAYPAAGFAADTFFRGFRKNRLWRAGFIGLILAMIIGFQIRNSFRFENDPSSAGLVVGQALRGTREQAGDIARPVLIEVSYWQFLAIHVGANDIAGILYDRPVDYSANPPPSVLPSDHASLGSCITRYDIAYIVMKSPDLIQLIQDQLNLSPVRSVNGYTIFRVPDNLETEDGASCSLVFSAAETRAVDGR